MSDGFSSKVRTAGTAGNSDGAHFAIDQARQHAATVGQHLIVDFWGAQDIDDAARLESAMRSAVVASGATLLQIHLHRFSQGDGITGIALLAESHISVHSWPEHNYSAFDIFMCGECDPARALESLRAELRPVRENIRYLLRGQVADPDRE